MRVAHAESTCRAGHEVIVEAAAREFAAEKRGDNEKAPVAGDRGFLGRSLWESMVASTWPLSGRAGIFDRSNLFARANRARQTAVINAVSRVPKGLAQFNTTTQHFNFLLAACRCIRRSEHLIFVWHEIFIVAVTQDCFEYVFAMSHTIPIFFRGSGAIQATWTPRTNIRLQPSPFAESISHEGIIRVERRGSRKFWRGLALPSHSGVSRDDHP
ncbi:hypothetical protein RB3911 [Rhodopirellula baltica SH 1]|uniref:Uncharacterized protein n=1 Tax=Rhodopirellula baltica (strain DSM 10527 / NCIMB 13988 / SH1) TaxID=243090 RepID=Q7UTF7_RHOBA|nr:hypothetical protein RB3911 [Rhodopirellula baltica SH 1]